MTPPLRHFTGRRVRLADLPPAACDGIRAMHAEGAVGVVRAGASADGRVRVEFPKGYGEGDGVRHFWVAGEHLRPA